MGLSTARRLASACVLSVAAAAFIAPGAASAASTQCSGSNVLGAGSSLQKLAQQTVWNPAFNTSANLDGCNGTQGTKGKPAVTYESVGSGAGLEDWGVKGHAFEAGRVGFVGTDEPVNAAQKAEIEANETVKGSAPESVQTIPVLQGAVAMIVNLPAGCTATSTAAPGRLVLDNITVEGLYRGTISKWSEITENGDTLSGTGCNPETPITRVARLDGSGTTHIFKKYLALVNASSFETEKAETKTWSEVAEGAENTTWPKAAAVVRPAKTGGGALVAKVAETPSSIGYSNLADARSNGSFSKTGTGGPSTAKFWTEVQNNGILKNKKEKYADPSTNGDAEATANANCAKTKYTNGKGTKFPPATTAAVWNEVTTATVQSKYPLCGLTYDMAFSKYSAYPGTTAGEAQTTHDFLIWVLDAASKAEGGQALINNHDYEGLPSTLTEEAEDGAESAVF